MGKPGSRSVLYRLIEVGQLARRALRVPLDENGLDPGDDALIFYVHEQHAATESDLASALEVDPARINNLVGRLRERGLIARHPTGPDLPDRLTLTTEGERVRAHLAAYWDQLESALVDDLPKKRRKKLRATLIRFSELLRL